MTTITHRPSAHSTLLVALRWVSRVGSVLVVGLLVAFGFSGGSSPTLQEWIGLLFFPIGLIAGLVLSWWREGPGAIISLASVACFHAWFFITRGNMTVGPYFLLLALPAVGFGLYALLRRG